MKYLVILIYFFTIFSCKNDNIVNAQSHEDKIKTFALPLDSKKINYSSKDKNGFFIYDKTFTKNQFSNLPSRVYGKISCNKNIDLLLIERKPTDDEHTEPIITIYSYNIEKKQKIDSLNIYETLNSEATIEKRFLIDKAKKIHVYENSQGYDITNNGKDTLIVENTETSYAVSDLGKFILSRTKEKSPKKLYVIDNWKGVYHFEASNRDNAKTVFDIIVKSLDNISINIDDDGSKESYSNIKAETINKDKIKVIYNSSFEDDMGTIYIEKSDDKFYISGTPIYLINPGNNEMPLKKIK